jgi:prolyl-tRNA synthetase
MRVSQMLLPTVKEEPAGAEAVSHKLMVRAGLVRQVAAGVYIYLPAGWRVMQKIAAIIRQEMDGIGCQELLMPVINPAELWEESGRYSEIGDELFRFKDRKGTPMVLAMTHEECITWIAAREVRSYKQLPQLWYHIQTKERDEARPKSGILRTREFIMKDSYSLDVSDEALQESYRKHIAAYDRIYRRCGLRFLMVQSDPGMMGGRTAHEYMAPSEAGEDDVVVCRGCGYAANIELAVARPQPLEPLPAGSAGAADEAAPSPGAAGEAAPSASGATARVLLPAAAAPAAERLQVVHTPGTRTIAEVTAFLGLPAQRLIKSLIVVAEQASVTPSAAAPQVAATPSGTGTASGAPGAAPGEESPPAAYMVLVRGDHELQESKLRKLIGDVRMATADEVLALQAAPAGFVGPVRRAGGDGEGAVVEVTGLPILADDALRDGVYVGGANLEDHHLVGIVPADWGAPAGDAVVTEPLCAGAGEPVAAAWVDVRRVQDGDRCLECEAPVEIERVIEVGNIFQLGTKYSIPMGATYLDEDGKEQPIVMGSYGIGLARIAAAAVEQHHDDDGIIWPVSIAPWQVELVCVRPADDAQRALAERLYDELRAVGLEVLYDDRAVSAGIKFKDADLLGCPLQVVVGKKAGDGIVELKERAGAAGVAAVAGVPVGPGTRSELPATEVVAAAGVRVAELLAALS